MKNLTRILPPRLKAGDHVRVVAPARSLGIISAETRAIANDRFTALGLKVSFGRHVEERDEFHSSAVRSRVDDLHEAFSDPGVNAVFTAIGGFNSNQLLDQLDFDLIRGNPKILSGFSDITVLQNAIWARTGLVTYSGAHYSTLGMKKGIEYTLEYLRKCLFGSEPFEVEPSRQWSDDPWFLDQEQRVFVDNPGFVALRPGRARGTIVGGNLCTLNLLQGTKYMPSLKGAILFVEDDEMAGALSDVEFDRNMQSLIQLPDFGEVAGIVIGRFQRNSKMEAPKVGRILAAKPELARVPIVADVDFGHTTPHLTFPVGGEATLDITGEKPRLTIEVH